MSSNTLKVLYVVDGLRQRSGVTSVVMSYFRNIDSKNVHIDFLIWDNNDDEILDEIRNCGSKIYMMPMFGLKNVVEFHRYINHFFEQHKNEYQILHSHFNQIDGIVFPIAKRCGIKKCISHSHNTRFSDYKLRAIRNRIMCLPIRYVADIWAACSIEAGVSLFGKKYEINKKQLVIKNAINCKKFSYNSEIRNKLRMELGYSSEIVLGHVGSLKPQKNQEFILRMFSKLKKVASNNKPELFMPI